MTVEAAKRFVVGIDLGTTHTVVAFTHPERTAAAAALEGVVQVLPLSQLTALSQVGEEALLPSALYLPLAEEQCQDLWGDAPWVVGRYAEKRGREVPGRLVQSAKSWLCHNGVDRTRPILPWGSDDTNFDKLSPVDASARILRHVSRAWEQTFPDAPLEQALVILTVPASFDQAARELTVRAALKAGLSVRLLEEPQAAFYDFMHASSSGALDSFVATQPDGALILVCDVGGGTTDLSLIELTAVAADATDATDAAAARALSKHTLPKRAAALRVDRVAVGRHLLLGGDNMDLALAHRAEAKLLAYAAAEGSSGARLEPARFATLVQASRRAKERLLAEAGPEVLPVTILGAGSALLGNTLSTELTRAEVLETLLEGFFPAVPRSATPGVRRAGLQGFGLPYEADAAITRHIAAFLERHAKGRALAGVLLNGGVFLSPRVARRLHEVVSSWQETAPELLAHPAPDLAVARGAVAYGLAVLGFGPRIGGGSAQGFYVGVAGARRSGVASGTERSAAAEQSSAVCIVPRGAKENEVFRAVSQPLALKLGRPVRFELFASDTSALHAPGELVALNDEDFELLPPIATELGDTSGGDVDREIQVVLQGELSAIGTLNLACFESNAASGTSYALSFELRGHDASQPVRARSKPPSGLPANFDSACEAIQRVFGKGRSDVKERETRDLRLTLERLLGERSKWNSELARALFDVIAPKYQARRRSVDHERVYWMLTGYCLRPGFGHVLDRRRLELIKPLFAQGLTFSAELRTWQQFFIAFRRIAAGFDESAQSLQRDLLDPFLAPENTLKKPKGFKAQQCFEMLELASWLERIAVGRRTELGRWILEATWTNRDPRLWSALARLGARQPIYASAHHVVPPRIVERWLDHLLREKWDEVPSAAQAAWFMARVTDDRARDVEAGIRAEVAQRLERLGHERWAYAVQHYVPVLQDERIQWFDEDLPLGLRLVSDGLEMGAYDEEG